MKVKCRDAGLDCNFEITGSPKEEIMELVKVHARMTHNISEFSPEMETKMNEIMIE